MKRLGIIIVTAVLCTMPGVAHAQRMLAERGETVETARQEALAAIGQGDAVMTISTVGFDIPEGSVAERYLQQVAEIGQGGYFAASDGGELTAAMGAAASGQAAPVTTDVTIATPREGERVAGRVVVAGTGRPGALIVVSTEVRAQDGDELLRDVPGSRAAIGEDGQWQVWVAAPVLPENIAVPLYYVIKAKWATRTEESQEARVRVLRAE